MRFLALFMAISLVEMATFFWVQSWIGLGWALGLAVLTALLGSYLVRRAGLSILGRIRQKLNTGQVPGRELSDGASILVSGAFLISPGFVTDILGFLLLTPPIRTFVYRLVSTRLAGRFSIISTGGARLRGKPTRPASRDADVIDVEGHEIP